IAALGGENFLKMKDRIEAGRAYSFYREQISGLSIATIYTQYLPVDRNKTDEDLAVREREAFGKNQDSGYVLFRKDNGWEVTFRGPKELPKDQLQRYRDTVFHDILYTLRVRLNEPGLIFESQGSDVIESQPVNIVRVTDSQNRVVTVNFNQDTKLPVRQVWYSRDPKTKERNEEITRYARYGSAGKGVQWPHEITRERNGERTSQIFSETVEVDQDLPDDIFDVPTGPATKVTLPKK
ncbi:MAG TPA: hypothetical protein VFW83_07300, partial [Bryobacteraceae bacterium]|nr:hypothetical protein [Bryobacteraceae bacterium]